MAPTTPTCGTNLSADLPTALKSIQILKIFAKISTRFRENILVKNVSHLDKIPEW
jgi:hypothetical protein